MRFWSFPTTFSYETKQCLFRSFFFSLIHENWPHRSLQNKQNLNLCQALAKKYDWATKSKWPNLSNKFFGDISSNRWGKTRKIASKPFKTQLHGPQASKVSKKPENEKHTNTSKRFISTMQHMWVIQTTSNRIGENFYADPFNYYVIMDGRAREYIHTIHRIYKV